MREQVSQPKDMETRCFRDGNINDMIERRSLGDHRGIGYSKRMHSSLVQRLSLERELEGHTGCVNAISWNSTGSLLISGSDDALINIWSYSTHKLLSAIETGHFENIFCTKFVPNTSDELVVSGAGDAEVRVFNLSRLPGRGMGEYLSAHFQCHSRRVKKLAVEIGNPNVVWSASEDGTLRQHDFRECASCPPAGSSHQDCHNVLLDLRCGAKRSLAEPPKQLLSLKSCDISSTRPHLLLVGGSDAFARLYDRRMLPSPQSSCNKKLGPPPCVNYFCPMHLADHGHSSLHLTHVTFSPEGDEVLLSYSAEHVYLMDVNHGSGNTKQYTLKDCSKLTSYSPTLNGVELESLPSSPLLSGMSSGNNVVNKLDKCRRWVQFAEKCLKEETDYFYGIESCNEVLDGYFSEVGVVLLHRCLCVRAALLLKRNWKNDVHMAIRDCYAARKIDSDSYRAFHLQSEALLMLKKYKEALDFALAAQTLAPYDSAIAETMENIKVQFAAAEDETKIKEEDKGSRFELQKKRVLSLSDILYLSESNIDEGLNLEVEPPILQKNGEGHETETNIPSGSLNPEAAVDMKQRYVGHCNVGTDIKQASFIGQKGEYIASGSDDGRWFIWEKRTGRLIRMLVGDEAGMYVVFDQRFDHIISMELTRMYICL